MTNTRSNDDTGNGGTSASSQTKNSGNSAVKSRLRTDNPLSKFSSYTYQISLYMLTPEAINNFYTTGTLVNSGASQYLVVAQSGGINSATESRALTNTGELGPNQQGLDYYLDNLQIEQYMLSGDGKKTATVASTFNFKVIEPAGFSFLSKLAVASQKLNTVSDIIKKNLNQMPTLYQQNYVVGIRFFGYDQQGNLVKLNTGNPGDQTGNARYGLYERYFPLLITAINFKLTGRTTEYQVESVVLGEQIAYGLKRGNITAPIELEGSTVNDLISQDSKTGLFSVLNQQQINFKNGDRINVPITYSVEWLSKEIPTAKVSNLREINLANTPMAPTTTTTQGTVKTSISPDANKANIDSRKVAFNPGQSIISILDQIIANSDYVNRALIKTNNERLEVNTDPGLQDNIELKWYAINPIITIKERDSKTNDWAYNITYQISEYEIPYIRTQYKTRKSKYYGACKEYNYWFTGKNTEVLSYEQTYNNLFYTIAPISTNKDDSSSNDRQGITNPTYPGSPDISPASATKTRRGTLIGDAVRATLYSIADQAEATIKIIGDPDFLMQNVGTRLDTDTQGTTSRPQFESGQFSKLYGKDAVINPYGGQQFIEIIFHTAEDYDNKTGLMDLDKNKKILFYGTEEVQNIIGAKGIVYKIIKVNSTFNRGQFIQELGLILVTPGELLADNTTSVPKSDDSYREAENRRFSNYRQPNINVASDSTSTVDAGTKKNVKPANGATPQQPAPVTVPNTNLDDMVALTKNEKYLLQERAISNTGRLPNAVLYDKAFTEIVDRRIVRNLSGAYKPKP